MHKELSFSSKNSTPCGRKGREGWEAGLGVFPATPQGNTHLSLVPPSQQTTRLPLPKELLSLLFLTVPFMC